MGKPNMQNNQVIQNLNHQLATEVQRCLDIVNASVAELIDGDGVSESSYKECCKTLISVCKEYKEFIMWKNKKKRSIPLDFLFLRKLKNSISEYKLMTNSCTLELYNAVCVFNEEKLRLSFFYDMDSVTVALNFRYIDFRQFHKTVFFNHIWTIFKDIHPKCELTIDGIYARYELNIFAENFYCDQIDFIRNTINQLRTNCKYYVI